MINKLENEKVVLNQSPFSLDASPPIKNGTVPYSIAVPISILTRLYPREYTVRTVAGEFFHGTQKKRV